MNIILFDDEGRVDLLPLTYTRPCANLRIGLLTLDEKWTYYFDNPEISHLTLEYLSHKFHSNYIDDNYYVNGRIVASHEWAKRLMHLEPEQGLRHEDGTILAFRSSNVIGGLDQLDGIDFDETDDCGVMVNHTYDIFVMNGDEIAHDFELVTSGRTSATLSSTNTVIGDQLFVEEGATVEAAVINASTGPVYIGKDATIMEGSLIRGPFAMAEGSTLKMGAKIYGPTTVGPECKVGGEVNNVVFYARSNKGHDGFLGNSVIGEWCNIGADSNSSNLKNNYAPVKLWNYGRQRFLLTGLQFCGLIMADHSKCGINTMFNTGTVVGVSANIFGSGFPRNFVPSFTWGGSSGFSTYTISKSFETASKVMQRRNQELGEVDKDILKAIFETSSPHRFWEKKPLKA